MAFLKKQPVKLGKDDFIEVKKEDDTPFDFPIPNKVGYVNKAPWANIGLDKLLVYPEPNHNSEGKLIVKKDLTNDISGGEEESG